MSDESNKSIESDKNNKSDNYGAGDIQVLEGTEGVRKRPSMYIGDTAARGLHHLVYEVIDNSIDEAMAGRCSQVEVKIHPDNSISILDDGAGIPAAMHPVYKKPTLEIILTKLHSGGKFDDKSYQVSGGLHGVGLAAVCALSEDFLVESYRDGNKYSQKYKEGKVASKMTVEPQGDNPGGTLIHFKPDTSIFTITEFDYDLLAGRFRELAYLTTAFRIIFTDLRHKDENGEFITSEYFETKGIVQFVEDSVGAKTRIMPEIPVFYSWAEMENVVIEVAMTYTDSFQENLRGFVNNINTHEGGTHLSGLKTILTRRINEFARDFKILKDKESNLSGNDVREGIIAIVSVKVPDPQFEGQTKTKLGNSEIEGYVQTAVGQPLKNWLIDNQNMGKAIINKAIQARRAREAAKKARDLIRKGTGRARLPGKLVESRTRDPMKRELYLVEGQSAGGTAVKARDNEFQEILFLRGKVLNVEKARLNRALENAEIRNIITAIGTGIQDDFDLSKCRYGKVILLTDADVDGAHIATLLFTFFYRYMKPLIEDGRLYIARPPLFMVEMKKLKPIYMYKSQDMDVFLDGLDTMGYSRKDLKVNRFKGLGEMNAPQLEVTSMAVETRKIDKVNINDQILSEDWLVKLMGDDVTPRKEFIRDVVFKQVGLEKKGEFFDIAFAESIEQQEEMGSEDADVLVMQEEFEKKQIEEDFDEYNPEQEFIDALEGLEF